MEGNIVVDGVLASCYAIVDHNIAQVVMKPIQWFPHVIELVFGDENAVSAYIDVARSLGRWVLPQDNNLD